MKDVAREVWAHNAEREFTRVVSRAVDSFYSSYLCVDTEFPGFVHRTPINASAEERYEDMRRNVDMTKIVQLGLTFRSSMGQSMGYAWQVNFREFNPAFDQRADSSVKLLRDSGIDFERNLREGVDAEAFSGLLWRTLVQPCRRRGTRWVMFHGLYDLGYIVKLLVRSPLPGTLPEFLGLARWLLGGFYDLKCMAKHCGFDERVGLKKIATELGVDTVGNHHQAGYDSLLIGNVFWKIKERFGTHEDDFLWILHGAEVVDPSSSSASLQFAPDDYLVPCTTMSLAPYGYSAPATAYQRHGCFVPGVWEERQPVV